MPAQVPSVRPASQTPASSARFSGVSGSGRPPSASGTNGARVSPQSLSASTSGPRTRPFSPSPAARRILGLECNKEAQPCAHSALANASGSDQRRSPSTSGSGRPNELRGGSSPVTTPNWPASTAGAGNGIAVPAALRNNNSTPATRQRASSIGNATGAGGKDLSRCRVDRQLLGSQALGTAAGDAGPRPTRATSSVVGNPTSSGLCSTSVGGKRQDSQATAMRPFQKPTSRHLSIQAAASATGMSTAPSLSRHRTQQDPSGNNTDGLTRSVSRTSLGECGQAQISTGSCCVESTVAAPPSSSSTSLATSLTSDAVPAAHPAEQEVSRRSGRGSHPPPTLRLTFGPCRWLSDESISYAYTQLNGSDGENNTPECGNKLPDDVLLIDPPTAFWLAMQTEQRDRNEARQALKIFDRKLVLCPVNDNRDGGLADAGTHWSLLVWDRLPTSVDNSASKVGRFIYYDSGGFHMAKCLDQAQALARHLAGHDVPVKVGACSKQTNSFDCGMYVILFSELIVKHFLAGGYSDAPVPEETPEPVFEGGSPWEARLPTVTPKEVADRRAFFYRTLSTMSAAAVAGGA